MIMKNKVCTLNMRRAPNSKCGLILATLWTLILVCMPTAYGLVLCCYIIQIPLYYIFLCLFIINALLIVTAAIHFEANVINGEPIMMHQYLYYNGTITKLLKYVCLHPKDHWLWTILVKPH